MKTLKVKWVWLEEALGLTPGNKELVQDYIASRRPEGIDQDEIDSVPEAMEKQTTVWPRDEKGNPFIWNYQIKGFFKDACGALWRADGSLSKKLKASKKTIDGVIFVNPRKIPIILAGPIGICERPMRTSGPKGDRTALSRSETVPAGSSVAFDVVILQDALEPIVREWFEYGKLRGFSQWRNSGKGIFEATVE